MSGRLLLVPSWLNRGPVRFKAATFCTVIWLSLSGIACTWTQPQTLTESNAGVFTNTQMNENMQSLVNSCSPATEWTGIGQGGFATDGLAGCVTIPSSATSTSTNGVATYLSSKSTTTNAVAGYFQSRALATGTHLWGINPIVSDEGFTVPLLYGAEIDANVSNSGTEGTGLLFAGAWTAQPTSDNFPVITVLKPGANQSWTDGLIFKDGSVGGLNNAAINIQAAGTGNNVYSMLILMNGRDSGGTDHFASVVVDPGGDLLIRPGSAVFTFTPGSNVLVPGSINTGGAAAATGIPYSSVGESDSTGQIAAAILSGTTGRGARIQFTDGNTLDLCPGMDNSGNFVVQSGCFAGNNGSNIFKVDTSGNVSTIGSLISKGTAAGLSGTGACLTITTQSGGAWAGSAKCTGTTGAATLTITPGTTAPNGWICNVQDETTRGNLFQQTSHTTTTCVLTVTSVTQNDVFVFSASAF